MICLFLIGNEQADEFVANAISQTNIISNQMNKQEHRGATIVSKFTSSTTWLPMPNVLSQSEPAIGKSCIWSECYMLIHDIHSYHGPRVWSYKSIQHECPWYNEFMFQWSHTSGITAHAQYVPREHAEQVARVCAAFSNAAGRLCWANMKAKCQGKWTGTC